jgi:glutathione S-transferase
MGYSPAQPRQGCLKQLDAEFRQGLCHTNDFISQQHELNLEQTLNHLPLTALVTLLICLVMFATGVNVARARGRYKIKAPAVTGHEMFERSYRIQMNTLESAMLTLPALWLYAGFIGDRGAAAMGAVWVVARIWYAIAYQSDPNKRGPGFSLSMLAFAGLAAGALWGIAKVLMQ